MLLRICNNKKCDAYGEKTFDNNENCGSVKYCNFYKCVGYAKERGNCNTNFCVSWL